MSHELVGLIGLDREEVTELKARVECRLVSFDMMPKVQLRDQHLYLARFGTWDWVGPVTKVVFHGIFEDDLPGIAALALWGGQCLPSASGLLDCRPRIANMARVRRVSRFATLPRSYTDAETTFRTDTPSVAKWGEWHCGVGKERFTGEWTAQEPSLIEPFIEGEAVRVTAIGDTLFQLRLGGDDWKKSIHHAGADFVPLNSDLAADMRHLRDHFDLAVCAADYIIAADGNPHLLELNHVPNVTQFPAIRSAYLDLAAQWIAEPPAVSPVLPIGHF
ncbi:hypothetical protein [Frigoriglobus tundricola]|uniref:ATP-grasp fold RimK-type domain-containing protein n=1 Tax=Frigoriglobus tundricola TaxID=2774151 RepID=A0A6M5YIK0_9BACT|nr:hypothetical protein [Frigoriglobus tundricola]QJW93818.1 hypothetical protein FTUN_1329 [Frigoriglobus tundricola]